MGGGGKFEYGFDVYKNAVWIPLITPRIDGQEEIDFPTSNVQLSDIILNRKVNRLPYVLCDSAYYAQPNRKLAIIVDDWFYIYNKRTKKEELYNMKLDPHQDINLMTNCIQKDIDRHCLTDIRQVILFPDWDEVDPTVKKMRQIKDSIWETGTRSEKIYRAFRYKAGRILLFIKGMTKNLR